MSTHHDIAKMTCIEEFILDGRCKKRKQPELAAQLIAEEAVRRCKLGMILEVADRCTRPSVVLAGLKFCGPLTKAEIRHILTSLPGRALRMDDDDSDGCYVDLAIARLHELGYPTKTAKAARIAPDGNVREFVTYELAEG